MNWRRRSVGRRLDHIEAMLDQQGEATMAAIDDLKSAVERIGTQDAAIIALCTGLSQQLKDALAAGNTQAIADIANQLGAQADAVAAAVAANTPAA